jgi:hypothetical protein
MGNRGVREDQELTGNTTGSSRRSQKVGIADELYGEVQSTAKGNDLPSASEDDLV